VICHSELARRAGLAETTTYQDVRASLDRLGQIAVR